MGSIAVIAIMDMSGGIVQSFTNENVQNGQVIAIDLSNPMPVGNNVGKINKHSKVGLLEIK